MAITATRHTPVKFRSILFGVVASMACVAAGTANAAVATFTQAVGGQSSCATFSVPAPILQFFGSVGTGVPSAGLAACGIAGSATHQTNGSNGPLSDTTTLGPTPITSGFGAGSFAGTASAIAQQHTVGASAAAQFNGPTDAFTVVGADAFGLISDAFVAAPDAAHPAGTPGVTRFVLTIDGTLDYTSLGAPASGDGRVYANYRQGTSPIFTLLAAGAGVSGNFVSLAPTGGISNFVITQIPGVSVNISGNATAHTFDMPFVYGTPFDFSLGLVASVQPRTRSDIEALFLSTAALTGMLVFESNGAPVLDFAFASGTGLRYDENGVLAPVPVPPATLLMVVMLFGLAARPRRQRH